MPLQLVAQHRFDPLEDSDNGCVFTPTNLMGSRELANCATLDIQCRYSLSFL